MTQKAVAAFATLAAVLLALSFSAEAQQPVKVSRVGILAEVSSPQIDAFRQGLRDLGYVEGQNLAVERRYAEGKRDRLPELAAELVRLNVDVVLAVGPATPYAVKSVKTIPVVFGYSGDPVEAGVVASLARPGGNATGMTFFAAVLAGKRVELLKEAFPAISRVAVLANPGPAGEQLELKETLAAAGALAVTVYYQPARAAGDFSDALDAITRQRANSLIIFPDALTLAHE